MLSSELLAADSSEEMDKTYYKIPVRPDPFIFILQFQGSSGSDQEFMTLNRGHIVGEEIEALSGVVD